MSNWHYTDHQRNRLGPVSAQALAELHRQGQLSPETLVWRDGMSEWKPWHEVSGEVLDDQPAITPVFATATAPAAPIATAAIDAPAPSQQSYSPYAPPRAALDDRGEFTTGGHVVYAGFWKRTAAYFIDSLVLGIVFGALAGVLGVIGALGMADPSKWENGPPLAFVLFYVIEIVAMVLYFACFHASSKQATPGKMAVGIKVTDNQGQRISLARGIGRFFAYMLSSLTLFIGLIMAGFTQRKRALHDMIAGTLVVDQWAYTPQPERQNEKLGTVALVVLILGGLLTLVYLAVIAVVVVALVSATQ